MKLISTLTLGSTLLASAFPLVDFASCHAREAVSAPPESPLFVPAPESPIEIAGDSSNVALGDMNGDGKLDLVLASRKSPSLRVLLGKGDGRFSAKTGAKTSVQDIPGEMAVGDVNGDGHLDVAVDSHDSYAVTLLLGDGHGELALAPNSPIVMKAGQHPHTHGLALADLNGDKKLDLVTVNNADNDLSVSFGDGHGAFAPAPDSPFAVGPSPYPLTLGDVNRDGRFDIVATASATGPQRKQQLPLSRALTLLLADGKGGFRTSQLPLRTGEPWHVAIGDVSGDREPDLLVTHHEMRELTVLLGDGRGGFAETSASPLDFGSSAFDIELADVDRDGKSDVLGATGGGVSVMLGDGRGGFRAAPHSPYRTGPGTWSFALGDVNSDGKVDLVAGSAEQGTIAVLLGQ